MKYFKRLNRLLAEHYQFFIGLAVVSIFSQDWRIITGLGVDALYAVFMKFLFKYVDRPQ